MQLSQELAEGNRDPHGVITDGDPSKPCGTDRVFPPPPAVRLHIQPNTSDCQGKALWPQNGHSAGRKADREHFEEGGGLDRVGGLECKSFLERRTRRKKMHRVPNHRSKIG